MCNLPGPPWGFVVSVARWVGGGSSTSLGLGDSEADTRPTCAPYCQVVSGGRGRGGGGASSSVSLGGGKKILEFYLFFPKTKKIKLYK